VVGPRPGAAPAERQQVASNRLDRPARGEGRILAGVCAGIAEHYGFSPFLVRVIFVILAITGASEIAYLVLWILMPNRR
jgi:phage shock protein C